MVIRIAILLFFLCIQVVLFGQGKNDKLYLSYGYALIPLHIERTDINRWMMFPSFEAGYEITPQISICGSYLLRDLRVGKYTIEEVYLYSETPKLNSYNEAILYNGNKFLTSEFSDYLFIGVDYNHFKTKLFVLQSKIQFGYRFGYSEILAGIFEDPSRPKGFSVHTNVLSSNSFGLKAAINPKIVIYDLITFEISAGSFIFTNWPVIQLFGNFQMGLTF